MNDRNDNGDDKNNDDKNNNEGVDVILPAGGRIAGEFARDAGAAIKALIRLNDETLLARTIAALRETGRARRIVVVGTHEDAELRAAASDADALLPEGETGPDNIFRALDYLRSGGFPPRPVLIVTTDLPFVTAASFSGFLERCSPDADLCIPVVERAEYEARFPHAQNEFVRLRDGQWTIGGAFLVRPDALEKSRTQLDQIFAARKSQPAMARLLGPLFIARFALRQLTVAHIERRCGQILGVRGVAVRGCAPELAFDIDQPNEYRYAVEWTAAGSPTAVRSPEEMRIQP